jgi:hypothetical protein
VTNGGRIVGNAGVTVEQVLGPKMTTDKEEDDSVVVGPSTGHGRYVASGMVVRSSGGRKVSEFQNFCILF